MQLKALCDFIAVFNGKVYKIKKGSEFKGDKDTIAHFAAIGLLEKASEKK